MTPQMWFAGITGVVFLAAILFIFARRLRDQTPLNPTAVRFFRIMIALFGAAFSAILTGFLTVDVKTGGFAIQAGAGLAVFVMLYLLDPPAQANKPTDEAPARADVLKIDFAPTWTLRQAIAGVADLAKGKAELEGFTDAQVDTALGIAVTVQGANGLAVLQQLSKHDAVKTKFSATYDATTATYHVKPT